MKNRIGELRRERGLTLKQMGEYLNIRDNTLSQYETGKREPQLGLMQEIAEFFDVSLQYLMMKTDKRDYKIENNNDAIALLKKIDKKEIRISHLSRLTSLELALWILQNRKLFFSDSKYSDLIYTANRFIERIELEEDTLEWYKDIRKEDYEIIEKIYEKLASEENYYGATPKEVLTFIEQSERIDRGETQEILKKMMQLPDAEELD